MKAKDGFLLRKIAGSYVIVPVGDDVIDFNGIITLNDSGRFLWELLQNDIEKEEILEKFIAEYGVEENVAKADIKEFMQTLLDAGVVEM